MRKRVSRPARFAAVDNQAIDTLPSILAIGLLTRLIRAKDGDDVTVESLSQDYDEGEKALTKAMRLLVDNANVVKFKIQRATTETVIEDGQEVVKRGGSWYTTFSVDSIPFTADDVAEMIEDIYADGNVKCHRVEPACLDPRNRAANSGSRPTPPRGGVGATCGNDANVQDRPTPPSPGVGQGGAHIRKKTSSARVETDETEGVPSARSAVGVRSTSTSGSSEPGGGSGFAAAAEESSSSDQEEVQAAVPGPRQSNGPELSREQLAAVRAVEALLPAVLRALLPYQQFPKRNRPAVLNALESRTVEQLRDRVERRWVAYGYEPALHDGALIHPIGAALELIGPSRYCPDPSCEDGTMVDTGADCRSCLQRRYERRAARAAGQLEKSSNKWVSGRPSECAICQAPFFGAVPDGGECGPCVREAEAAFAALTARLAAPHESQQPERAPETVGTVQGQSEVDEETVRLRAMYAHQFGTPEQVEAYCTDAPF
ncbi:hypothetical protein [Streptomyces sp. NPDC008092]|uniref:hypothetical protein n=1 Tax=Streptomyces sp. NPDC008092 TaxID=3364808 RepID=UPI0036E4C1EC